MSTGRIAAAAAAAIFIFLLICLLAYGNWLTESATSVKGMGRFTPVRTTDYYSGGVHYKIFDSTEGGIFVVNITADSLAAVK